VERKPSVERKPCCRYNLEKPACEFYINKRSSSGLESPCKVCATPL